MDLLTLENDQPLCRHILYEVLDFSFVHEVFELVLLFWPLPLSRMLIDPTDGELRMNKWII